MIILPNLVKLYGKKVVTDLATRVGNCTLDTFSYGVGKADVVKTFLPGETDANMGMLFNNQSDFDADIKQPHLMEDEYDEVVEAEEYEVGQKYDPAVDTTDFDRYLRRLEDIASDYTKKYISNLVYSIVHRTGGIKEYNKLHADQPVLMSNDDEDFTELADLQVIEDVNNWTPDQKQNALQRLPYVIKRLHNMSCYTGIHMLSFVVAFVRAEEKNYGMRVAGSIKSLKKNAVIEEGVYTCDKSGNILKQVLVQHKNKKASDMFDWLIGVNKEHASYFQDYLDFIHYCKVLNIDIMTDDMTKYQANFVNKLVITTVTPNKQYDKKVFSAILSNKTNQHAVSNEPADTIDVIENTINTFLQICKADTKIQETILTHDTLQSRKNMYCSTEILQLYKLLYFNTTTDTCKYSWVDGFLYYDNELVVVRASICTNPDGPVFDDDRCIISELGYVIHVSPLMSLYCLTVFCAKENILNRGFTKDPEYRYVPWQRFGV